MAATRKQSDALVTDINGTPLVAIMRVLLIIFMLTSTTIVAMDKPRGVDLDLPTAAAAQERPSRPLHIVLNKPRTSCPTGRGNSCATARQ